MVCLIQISTANYSHWFLKEIPFKKNFTAKQQEILGLKITYYIRVEVILYLLSLYFCLKTYSICFYFTKKATKQRFALANKVTLANISKYINLCLRTAREKELLKYPEECFSTKRPIHNLRTGQKYPLLTFITKGFR